MNQADRPLPHEDKETVQLTADFPDLVDIVVAEGGEIEFLFLWPDGSHFEASPRHVGGSRADSKLVVHTPPPKVPWLLPRRAEVLRWINEDTDEAYFSAVEEWIARHTVFADPRHVTLLAAWIVHTYVVDQCHASPYILLLGPPESGKTRALSTCIHAARRGVLTMSVREAALIRYADNYKATVAIDAVDFMDAIRTSKDFFAARTRNDGGTTMRVTDFKKGPFQGEQHFEAFGATIVASNFPLSDDVIASRCIVIQAQQAFRQFPDQPTQQLAREVRERGTAFRARFLKDLWHLRLRPAPQIATGRLGEMLSGLAWVADRCRKEALSVISDLVPSFSAARHAETAETIEVDLVRVCLAEAEAGSHQVKLVDVVKRVNEMQAGERPFSGRKLSGVIRSFLGLKVEAGGGNQRYVLLDRRKLAALAIRYALPTAVNGLTSGAPNVAMPSKRRRPR